MKPHRVRQICRSRNPFSPSIALWQHFVLPYHPLRQQCLSSSTAETTASSNHTPEAEFHPSAPSPISQLEDESRAQNEGQFRVVRVVDRKGRHEFSNPRDSSIRKNIDSKARSTTGKVLELLLQAKMAFDESEDYDGVIVEAMTSRHPIPEQYLPWSVKYATGAEKHAAHDRLTLEIAKFHEYAKPSRTEALARKHVIEQMRAHTREILPDHILEVFGSERTGIALAPSDIDLRLMRREDFVDARGAMPPSPEHRKDLLNDLYKLQRKQLYGHEAYLLPTLRHARYPLISVQDRASGLDIQIVLSNDTSISRDIMQRYMQEYPYLRQVYSVVKSIFDARGLSDVFRGGFGSYSIFMMLVASLKHAPGEKADAATALTNFLQFWGNFDTQTKGVSIDPPAIFDKTEELVMTDKSKAQIAEGVHKPLPKYMLCLRDPADETNDLGRKGICIKHVQATLRSIHRRLQRDMRKNTRASLLRPLVGDIYAINKPRREKLAEQGRRVLNTMQSSFAQTAKAIREEDQRKRDEEKEEEALEWTPGESGSEDFGEAVTSILGMPSKEKWSENVGEMPKDDVRIAYEQNEGPKIRKKSY